METLTNFKLKNAKPDKDFVEWNELMSKNYNQDYYYERSHPFIVWVERKRLQAISELINEHLKASNLVDPTILEVGCGAGHVLREISNKISTKNLIGVDILEDWLNQAKEKLGNKAKLIKGFAEELPFDDNSIDYIICSEVLEHVIDPIVILNEIKRTVKKDGLIVISIPNETIINKIKDIFDSLKLYDKLFPNLEKHNDWHIHCFDLQSFKDCIPKGIEIQNIKPIPNSILPLRYVISFKKDY